MYSLMCIDWEENQNLSLREEEKNTNQLNMKMWLHFFFGCAFALFKEKQIRNNKENLITQIPFIFVKSRILKISSP